MPQIEKVDLPPATADGSAQWFKVHRVPTHGQVKAIAASWASPDLSVMDTQTVVVRQLVPEAVVKDDDGREIAWNGKTPDEQGAGIDDVPQVIVTLMFEEAVKGVSEAFPDLVGNRAGRRQRR